MNDIEDVVAKLIEKKMTISFAESCTGGMVAASLVSVPRASFVLNESYVTYSCEAKSRILNIDLNYIEEVGVVSEEVAKLMASGVKKIANANIGVGVTGYAGPDGEDVGVVCFAIAMEDTIIPYTARFCESTRKEVISEAVKFIYSKLKEVLFDEGM